MQAVAHLTVDERQRVEASIQLRPADMEGGVSLRGSLQGNTHEFAPTDGLSPGSTDQGPGPSNAHSPSAAQRALDKQVDVTLAVHDGGMAVLCALTPALQWQAGAAALNVDVRGSLAQPHAQGSVHMSNVTLSSPVLKNPVTHLKADVQVRAQDRLEQPCRQGMLQLRVLFDYAGT